jgi:hypothetical protein
MHIDFAHANPLPKVRSSILIGVETPCTLAASDGITREQGPDSSSGLSLSTNADDGLAFRVCDNNHTALTPKFGRGERKRRTGFFVGE